MDSEIEAVLSGKMTLEEFIANRAAKAIAEELAVWDAQREHELIHGRPDSPTPLGILNVVPGKSPRRGRT